MYALNTFDPFKTLDFLFEEVFDRPVRRPAPRDATLRDSGDSYSFRAVVPGLSLDNVSIEVDDRRLSLAVKHTLETPDGFKKLRAERAGYSWNRQFSLPESINTDAVSATLKDGVLTITLPKAEVAGPKKVAVAVG